MPKQIVMIMQDNYPFGECENCDNENTRVLVRKIYEVRSQQQSLLLDKLKILRKLKTQNMIKISSVLQEEESIHILFEYIPIKLETWISHINDQFIENFRDQIIKFSAFLANNYIKIAFQLKNIGMDQNYQAKYFLDLNFVVDPTINREKLKSNYIRQITNIFKPYISSEHASKEPLNTTVQKSAKEPPQTKEAPKKQTNTSVWPATNKKQKILQKYYQQVNMSVDSESDKILQEFMDVLDNEEADTNETPAVSHVEAKPKNNNSQSLGQFQKKNDGQQPHSVDNAKNFRAQPDKLAQSKNETNRFSPNKIIAPPQNIQNNYKYANATKTAHQSPNLAQKSYFKNTPKQLPQPSKEDENLQNRIKSALQKSVEAIKKFRAIKQNPQI